MIQENTTEIIKFFTDNGFVVNTDIEQFTQLDRLIDGKYKIISIVIMKNQNIFYILLHTKHTDDYIFSKRYKLNCNGQELKNLLNKIRQFYLMFDFLF